MFRPIAAGDLVVITDVDVDRRAARFLRSPGVAVVIEVAVRDEDAADVAEAQASLGESVFEGFLAFARADAGVEERDTALVFLDDVDVRRPARLGERHGHGDAGHAKS